MNKIILDRELRARLHNLAELLELHDENGAIVGYFAPVVTQVSPHEDVEVPITDEEVQRLLKQPAGRPLSDILADLERTPA
jgi:hypothetical protein